MSELFERSEQYAEMLHQGIRLSGENQDFFIAGRIRHLQHALPPGFCPRRILDFGCGTGSTVVHLSETFPQAEVVGVDTAASAIAWAQAKWASSARISFCTVEGAGLQAPFDLCYSNGVFHHIPPVDRPEALRWIHRALAPEGLMALFENNPWNPGTRMVMKRIPFDRDAQPLSPLEARALLRATGFCEVNPVRSLFYFPRPFAFLRFSERWLSCVPLGAQYCVIVAKG